MTLPPLVLGTMTFGDTADRATSAAIFDLAVAEGITWIDTANVYAGGATEELLAEFLPGAAGLTLATKVGMPHPDIGDHAPLSREGIRLAFAGSLRRLRVERVDVLYLHKPDPATPMLETLEEIASLIAEGRIARFGVSNYAAWQLSELLHLARELGIEGPVASQQLYNPIARRLDEEYAAFAAAVGLETVVYNPLAGGLLTGRYRLGQQHETGRFGSARIAEQYRDRYWDSRLFGAVDALAGVARSLDISLVELSLRWARSRQVVDSVLLGASSPTQLASSIDAIRRGGLDLLTLREMDLIAEELRGPMPVYNR